MIGVIYKLCHFWLAIVGISTSSLIWSSFFKTFSTLSRTYWLYLVCQHVSCINTAWFWHTPPHHHEHSFQILSYNLFSHLDDHSRFNQEWNNHDLIYPFNFQMMSVSMWTWCQQLRHDMERYPEWYYGYTKNCQIIIAIKQLLDFVRWRSCFICLIV